jgi:hypothetical protein
MKLLDLYRECINAEAFGEGYVYLWERLFPGTKAVMLFGEDGPFGEVLGVGDQGFHEVKYYARDILCLLCREKFIDVIEQEEYEESLSFNAGDFLKDLAKRAPVQVPRDDNVLVVDFSNGKKVG